MTANHEICDDFVCMADKRSAPHEPAGTMVLHAKVCGRVGRCRQK